MQHLRVIIADDEPLARSLMSSLLDEIPYIDIVEVCDSGAKTVNAVMQHLPDILFLDIEMPEMSGFDVIAAIQNDILPKVVFTTAYAQYAVEAFKVQALDYLLKPIDDKALLMSVERARLALKTHRPHSPKPNLLSALYSLSENKALDNTVSDPSAASAVSNSLMVKDSEKISFLDPSKIEWVEAAGDYVCIHMGGKTRLIRATLKSIEDNLQSDHFKRIHRSTLVNFTYVTDIIPAPKGEAFACMKDGQRLKVSRKYGNLVRNFFKSEIN